MVLDFAWYTKNSKNKSILALGVTLFFDLLHITLWACIYYKLNSLDMTLDSHSTQRDHVRVEISKAIANISTLGIAVDVVCVLVTLLALYGVGKDFEGRHFLYTWVFGMILYVLLESLISWCFIYWAYRNDMASFVLVTAMLFWIGRTFILVGCMVQVTSHFTNLMKPIEPPAIIVTEQRSTGQGARKRRSPSVATVSTTVSNMSDPDGVCEKQYIGHLPCAVDFETMYPSYFFDDYDPTMYPIDFGYDYYQYGDYPQHLVSPTYEEATSSSIHNPPPYSTDFLGPPSYMEADQDLVASAQVIDSTAGSGLIHPVVPKI